MPSVITSIEERILHVVELLQRHIQISAAFLFGSQADGTADFYSDVDIAIFSEDWPQMGIRDKARLNVLVQKQLGDDLEIHFFSATSLVQAPPASFAEFVIKNGTRIGIDDTET